MHVIHFFVAQVWQCSPNCLAGVDKRAIIKLLVLRGKLLFFFQYVIFNTRCEWNCWYYNLFIRLLVLGGALMFFFQYIILNIWCG